jgi:hypothetical protein
MTEDARAQTEPLEAGNTVAVRTRFDGTWADGYRICRERGGRYQVERCSDGVELPATFESEELRAT